MPVNVVAHHGQHTFLPADAAKRSEHAVLMVDGMKEAHSLVRIIARVPDGKFSMCARRERPDEPTAFASAGKNVCWPWWATTSTGTDMNAKSNCKGS